MIPGCSLKITKITCTLQVQEELKEPIQKAEQAVSRIQARITEYSVASSD